MMRAMWNLVVVASVAATFGMACAEKKEATPMPGDTGSRQPGAEEAQQATEHATEEEVTLPGPAPAEQTAAQRPLYYERPIAPSELEDRSLRELSLMRNTIFARAGNSFRKKWLRDHFEAQPWYQARGKVDESGLTEYDRQNARKIAEAEVSFTREQLDERLAEVQARAAGGKATAEDDIELRLISSRLGVWKGSADVPRGERSPLEDPTMLDSLLDLKQLDNMSPRDLRLLRNTIYARRGRSFKSPVLTEYFEGMGWYSPDDSYSDARLTEVDKKNIRLVRSVEDSLGGPLADRDHMQEEGWFARA
jgi:hypothetical protein